MEVSPHHDWFLKPSFFPVGRITCRDDSLMTGRFTDLSPALRHQMVGVSTILSRLTPTLQHRTDDDDSRDINPAHAATLTTGEENPPPNLLAITHEGLANKTPMSAPNPLLELYHLRTSSPQFPTKIVTILCGTEYKVSVEALQDRDLVWLVDHLDNACLSVSSIPSALNFGVDS